jgi:phosphate transport system permease protein
MAVGASSRAAVAAQTEDIRQALQKHPRFGETIIQGFLFVCAALSILTTIGIVYELGKEAMLFFNNNVLVTIVTTSRVGSDGRVEVIGEPDTIKTLITPKVDTSHAGTHQETFAAVIAVSADGRQFFIGDNDKLAEIAFDVKKERLKLVNHRDVTFEDGLNSFTIHNSKAGDQTLTTAPDGSKLVITQEVGIASVLAEFFTQTRWTPAIGEFGVWPLVTATLTTSLMAMGVALPLGLGVAIYLSEYASHRARSILKPVMEVLAGVPTVVYGYFALTFMTPLLRSILGENTVEIYNTASAGIVIGILIIPLVSSMSEDALSAVPNSLRQAAYGLGATKLETAIKIVLPAALSGVAAAFIVAISRAIGETMVVAIAAGAGPAFTLNPFEAAETMTGHIVRISGGDISYDSIDYNSLFAIGLLLFLMTLVLNIVSRYIVQQYREVYE